MTNMLDILKKYNRLQFCAKFQPNFRGDFVHHSEIPDLMRKYEFLECYASSFLYSYDVLNYIAKNRINGKPSISSYGGVIWGTYLFTDLDSRDLEKSLLTAKQMVSFLTENWKLPYESVLVYFSGHAGYHVMIDHRVFGVVSPSPDLNVVFAVIRKELPKKARVTYPETVDQSIGDKARIIRLPDTINIKSGLRKIQLTIPELFELGTEDIKEKAKKKQPLYFTDLTGMIPTEYVKPNPKATEFYTLALRRVRKRPRVIQKIQTNPSFPDHDDPIKYLCPARQGLWNHKIEEEYRHNSAIRLVAQFRLLGVNQNRSRQLMTLWNSKRQIGLPDDELENIVRYVYAAKTPYLYSCNFEKLQEFCPYQDRSRCSHYRTYKKLISVD
jgi:hypothetical protein